MTAFHHPSSQPRRWQRDAVRRLPALLQGGRIPLRLAGVPRRCPGVPFVAAEVLWGAIPQIAAAQDASLQGRGQQRHIRRFRAADDEGQRDATPVHQETLLAPIFFPDPWGWAPRLLALTEPWSTIRQCSATSRQCPASRHIPLNRLATGLRTGQPPPIPDDSDESRSDSQTTLWARLSIEFQFARRTRSRQRLVLGATASVRLRVGVDIPGSGRAAAWELMVPLSARRPLRLPMIEPFVCVSCWTTRTAMRFLSSIIYG